MEAAAPYGVYSVVQKGGKQAGLLCNTFSSGLRLGLDN